MDKHLTFKEERFSEIKGELSPLLEKNNEEIDLFHAPLIVSSYVYEFMEEHNASALFTVRHDSKLVGYCLFWIYRHCHHFDQRHAKADVIYIMPEYRGIGREFIRYCDEQLKLKAVHFVQHAVPQMNDWGILLERKGYQKIETIYSRRL